MCLLGEHPSGQRKTEPAMVNRDKREAVSTVDMSVDIPVDNLPTGPSSGALSMGNRKIKIIRKPVTRKEILTSESRYDTVC